MPIEKKTRIVSKRGEWLERYVLRLLQLAGFKVEMHKKFKAAGGLMHEIDIYAEESGFRIAIECKDYVGKIPKGALDAFITKVRDIKADYGLFVVSQFDEGDYLKYRKYLDEHGIRFVDGMLLEQLWDEFLRLMNKDEFKRRLCKILKLRKKRKSFLSRIFKV